MKTTLSDIVKIRKTANVQFFKLVDTFVNELKLKIKSKKKVSQENFIIYTVPPYRLGSIVYERNDMYEYIFKKIKEKYRFVSKRDKFRIYIEWKMKNKENIIIPKALNQIETLINANAKLNRTFCIYTLPVSIEHYKIYDFNKTMQKIEKSVSSNGFKTEISGNKIMIYWSTEKPNVSIKPLPSMKIVRPKPIVKINKLFEPMETNKPILALNKFSPIIPIDTRSNDKDIVMKMFRKEVKKYSGNTVKSLPGNNNKLTGHKLQRRTLLDSGEISKQLNELSSK